ncbi:YqaJ viral recombinase family protein [Nonomuraea longicatena]|uniref:YqaJ viral recombinase domain-containing protein n=1 Tax=Nonomuraea longicatena TaxID=83682 RepID=A0ABP3ZE92_9ACTN
MTVLAAHQVPTIEPGSPDWFRYMSASKAAAVLGLSPWESPFSLWCLMAGLVDPEPQTKAQARGHYLEPAVANWLADRHPEYRMLPGGTWVSNDRPWQLSSPDRLLYAGDELAELIECKTDADGREWGRPGTNEIPLYYLVQVLFQMDTIGARRTRVGLLTGRLEFREYVVDYDEHYAAVIRERCESFMASLLLGDMPDLDDRKATYESLRRQHPLIDRAGKYFMEPGLAIEVIDALQELESAEAAVLTAKGKLLVAMGTARRAYFNGDLVAIRMAKGAEGVPFLKFEKALPDISDLVGAF